ncbi:unnamed protein product [Acanthoscelides obtectus]|uniref:Tubulin glycylase 3A-like n=1 Tax=Acanthoscelides obtectus TaxID=200917 RepID=A0A9P0LAT9_ACAOB|nr:unnamed protein product [Acanthoscelides obtectus]CAK1629611.1 Tubulin glycylase 3A [Acanthoscelides obtectus]
MSRQSAKVATASSSETVAKNGNAEKEGTDKGIETETKTTAKENGNVKKSGQQIVAERFPEKGNESILTLTKMAEDMSQILENLNVNLSMLKKKDDLADIEPELENLIHKKQSTLLLSQQSEPVRKTDNNQNNQKIDKNPQGQQKCKDQAGTSTPKTLNVKGRPHSSPPVLKAQKTPVPRPHSPVLNNATKLNVPAGAQHRSRSAAGRDESKRSGNGKISTTSIRSPSLGSRNRQVARKTDKSSSVAVARKEDRSPIVNTSVGSSDQNLPVSVRSSPARDRGSSFAFLQGIKNMLPNPSNFLASVRAHSASRSMDRESYNPLGSIRDEVKMAIKNNKTFTIKGSYPGVRRSLLKRGWVEKIHVAYRDRLSNEMKKFQSYSVTELVRLLHNKDISEICRRLIKSKLLINHQVDLYWSTNYEPFRECSDKVKQTLINRIRRAEFAYTSKQGLCEAAKRSFWCQIPGVAQLNHPRSYALIKNTHGDTEDFIGDFNVTAAMSMLKWVKINSDSGQVKIVSPAGKIPVKIFDFAVMECYKFIKKSRHEDIDFDIEEALSHEWSEFLEHFYKLVHVGNHFKAVSYVEEANMVRKANYILEQLNTYWPYLDMDGIMNIWILKPTNSSQGVGIHMCRTLKYVLDVIKKNPNRRYVIQKYIDIGFPHAFEKIIYPGMKQSIIAAILLNEEKIEPRKNSFELYGADFMITEDFKPWLLEINSSPALYASTPVTAKMCPVVLEDVIKVIVDHSRNNNASTGLFELAYKGQ